MWGMIGLSPDWMSTSNSESDENVAWDSDETVHVGDIIRVATRNRRPVLMNSINYDDHAELRILGTAIGDSTLYMCLVTDGDAEHVSPTVIVGKGQAYDYGVEKRFYGCDGIILSENHLRGIVKKQRGRHCEKCTEYNEDIRLSNDEVYLCSTCRENPWR